MDFPALSLRHHCFELLLNRARLLVIASAVLAALFVVPFKLATGEHHGIGAAFGLMLFAASISSVPLVRSLRGLPKERFKASMVLAVQMALFGSVGNLSQGLAMERLQPAVAASIFQMQILAVATVGWFWLKESLKTTAWLGIILALIGLWVMREPITSESISFELGDNSVGILIALLSASSFGLMDVAIRGKVHVSSPTLSNALRLWLTALLLAFYPGALEQFFQMEWSQRFYLMLAALLGPTCARLLIIAAAKHLPAAENSLYQQLRPIFALPIVGLWLGTWPNTRELIGSSLLLLGVSLPSFSRLIRPRS